MTSVNTNSSSEDFPTNNSVSNTHTRKWKRKWTTTGAVSIKKWVPIELSKKKTISQKTSDQDDIEEDSKENQNNPLPIVEEQELKTLVKMSVMNTSQEQHHAKPPIQI